MGEIAEAMVNGDLCEGCGEYLGKGDGFPRRCGSCKDMDTMDALGTDTDFAVDVIEKHGGSFWVMNIHSIRFTIESKTVDMFIGKKGRKYHIHATNERGRFNDPSEVIKKLKTIK